MKMVLAILSELLALVRKATHLLYKSVFSDRTTAIHYFSFTVATVINWTIVALIQEYFFAIYLRLSEG